MERKTMNKKRIILIVVFLSMFTLGTFLIFTTPSSIKITYGKTVITKDKETISFDVFEPNNVKKDKPAIIIGHGIMVNKEMLKEYGVELAASGFVAITFDFRGHGQSSGELNRVLLRYDIKAIKKYLDSRGDVDMDKLGYIGYSMGGGPGNTIVKDDEAFKCFIGIGTSLSIDDDDCENRTLNILMILSKYDQAFDLKTSKKEIADRLDRSPADVRVNTLYGSFEDGDATKLFLDDNSDHLTGPAYDQDFIREARDWVKSTFPGVEPVDSNFYANIRALILVLQLVGGIGFFLLILDSTCGLLFKKEEKDSKEPSHNLENQSLNSLIKKSFIYLFVLFIPGILIMLVFFLFLPISTAGFTLMLLYGAVFSIFILLWRIRKSETFKIKEIFLEPFRDDKIQIIKHVILGIVLGATLIAILYLSIGLNYLGIIPSFYEKIYWIPIYFLVVFIMYFIFGRFYHEIIQTKLSESMESTLKISLIIFSLQIIYFIAIIMLLSVLIGSLFFTLFFYIAIPIFYLSSLIFTILYKKTGSILSGVIINTILQTLIICTLSPYMLGLDMILIFSH
ncbi:MAG: alpha/beta fold hydrolase [Candidatus Hermodarchaeota archaeon]